MGCLLSVDIVKPPYGTGIIDPVTLSWQSHNYRQRARNKRPKPSHYLYPESRVEC